MTPCEKRRVLSVPRCESCCGTHIAAAHDAHPKLGNQDKSWIRHWAYPGLSTKCSRPIDILLTDHTRSAVVELEILCRQVISQRISKVQ